MKKLLFASAIALTLIAGMVACYAPGFAQGGGNNSVCPNRPLGDNGTACANTAFVQQQFATPSIPLTNGHIFVGNASNVATDVPHTGAGDCTFTLANTGVATFVCTKTNSVAFAASATTDTTNATNIATGTLANARLAGTQNTVKGAATSAVETDLAVPSCSTASSALQWTTNTGFGCGTIAPGGTGSDLIWNGSVQVDQTWEGGFAECDGSNNPHTGASQATETYGPDNWRIGCDIGTGRWHGRRTSIPGTFPGLPFMFQATVTTADAAPAAGNHYQLEITIEGPNIAQLAEGTAGAKALTCQFWVNASVSGTYSMSLADGNNNYTNVQTFSVPSPNTSTFITLTFPADTNTGHTLWQSAVGTIGLKIFFDFGSGSTFQTSTLGSWQSGFFLGATGATRVMATNGNTNYYSGLQCDPGSVALPYRYRSFADDLVAAQHYYYKSFAVGTAVAQAAGSAGAIGYVTQIASTTAGFGVNVNWPKMSIIPSIVTFNPVSANAKWRNETVNADSGTPSIFVAGTSGAVIFNPQIAAEAVNGFEAVHFVANGRLGGF